MKLVIILAGLLVAAHGDDGKPKERQLVHQPLASSLSPNDQQQLLQYLIQVANNPLYKDQAQRFGWGGSSTSSSQSTTTVTSPSTSVISITCTVSTTACASGRRRRSLLSDLIDQQFEEIKPSAVNPVEATPSAGESISMREGKEANPQYVPHYYKPYQAQGSLEPSSQLGRQTVPSFLSPIVNPAIVLNNVLYSALVPQYLANLFPNLGDALPLRQSAAAVTVTSVPCTYSFTTMTSTPSCSTPGTLLQCPASTTASG